MKKFASLLPLLFLSLSVMAQLQEVKGIETVFHAIEENYMCEASFDFTNSNPFPVSVDADLYESSGEVIIKSKSFNLDAGETYNWKTGNDCHSISYYVKYHAYKIEQSQYIESNSNNNGAKSVSNINQNRSSQNISSNNISQKELVNGKFTINIALIRQRTRQLNESGYMFHVIKNECGNYLELIVKTTGIEKDELDKYVDINKLRGTISKWACDIYTDISARTFVITIGDENYVEWDKRDSSTKDLTENLWAIIMASNNL